MQDEFPEIQITGKYTPDPEIETLISDRTLLESLKFGGENPDTGYSFYQMDCYWSLLRRSLDTGNFECCLIQNDPKYKSSHCAYRFYSNGHGILPMLASVSSVRCFPWEVEDLISSWRYEVYIKDSRPNKQNKIICPMCFPYYLKFDKFIDKAKELEIDIDLRLSEGKLLCIMSSPHFSSISQRRTYTLKIHNFTQSEPEWGDNNLLGCRLCVLLSVDTDPIRSNFSYNQDLPIHMPVKLFLWGSFSPKRIDLLIKAFSEDNPRLI